MKRSEITHLPARGVPAVSGDAVEPAVLIQAHVARARMLAIAVPDAFLALRMIEIARQLNPGIETVAYVHSEEEAMLLQKEKIGKVFMDEHELAFGITRHVIGRSARASATKKNTK